MNITEIKNDKTDFHVKVTIPSKEISSEIEKELAKLAKDAKIDGFRVGKVPTSFLEKKYGASLRAEAVKNKIVKAIGDITKDKNLRVLMDPEVEDIIDEENKDLEFIIKYQLFPEITIPDFKSISIEKPILELKDKDIDEQLEKLVSTSKEYNKVSTSKAKKGDQVTIDAVGYVDGKAFAGGKLDSHKLVLGSGVFIPGFEDQLIGAKTGDDVSVKVDFPKDYHEKTLAGKPSEFKVKILEIHSESEVKPIKTMMKMALFDKLENMLEFDVPKTLLDREISILEKQATEVEDKELEEKSSKNKEAYFTKLALRRVKLGLMLAEYVKIHKLEIDKTDIQKAIMEQAKNFPGRENEIIDFYLKHPKALESLKGPVLEDKAVKTIFEKEVKLLEKSYSKDKLEKLLAKNANDHLPESSHDDHLHRHSHEHIHDENCNHDYDHDGYVKAHKHEHINNPENFHDHSREHNDKRDQKKAKAKK